MHKLTIQLKQHTPIIHFQHNQVGATLRATEVKPKLDRFVLEKLGEGNYENGRQAAKQNGWLIDDEKRALNYKMRIKANGSMINEKMHPKHNDRNDTWGTQYPTFFANMGKENKSDLINFVQHESSTLSFLFKNEKLEKEFTKYLNDFFLHSNFGTRQSKGFGSFYIDKDDPNYIEIANTPFMSLDGNCQTKDVFNVINYYHQRLKSGVNYSYKNKNNKEQFCHYEKAYLYKYMQDNKLKYNWDKKWLKEKFFPLEKDNEDKRFVRALLGLSYDFKFIKPKFPNPCNPNKGIYPHRKLNVSIDTTNSDLQRIKSPILYKPVRYNTEWKIYIVVNAKFYDQPILNQKFDFSDGRNTKSIYSPQEPIELNDLINSYNNELGQTFQAYQFNGNYINVKIS